MTQNERLDFLINHLISEDNRYSNIVIPKDSEEKFNLLRSLVNVLIQMYQTQEYATQPGLPLCQKEIMQWRI